MCVVLWYQAFFPPLKTKKRWKTVADDENLVVRANRVDSLTTRVPVARSTWRVVETVRLKRNAAVIRSSASGTLDRTGANPIWTVASAACDLLFARRRRRCRSLFSLF